MRHVLWLVGLLVSMAGPAAQAATEGVTAARVIVKFKAGSSLLRAAPQSATGESQQSAMKRHAEQAGLLGQRHGLTLSGGAPIGERAQVVKAAGMSSEQLAAELAKDSDLEYAVPDQRRHIAAAPNDPLYATGNPVTGPASGQWYLRAPTADVVSSIDAEGAWAITLGSPTVVVAMIDTGVRYDHADLLAVASGGNLLPGYDMIADSGVSNDGDGRDSDASDPGDWVTAAEANQVGGAFYHCGDQDARGNYIGSNSSWHGTQTASLVGALTDNSLGMASVGRTVHVLPVRVLGKCGGYDSDIQAGMLWAAGIHVAGVPDNPNPARIVSLSLGGTSTCSADYVSVISQLTAQDVLVVVSAGNGEGTAVSTPANCAGVLAVAGLRHAGTKVGFSSIGPEVALSAPGGNCVNTGANQPCLYPIITALNAGTTTPIAGSSIYSDAVAYSVGTSFSAPLVAGTAALMLAARPGLSAADLTALLKGSTRPFPTSGGDNATVPQCHAPVTGGTQDECYCTVTTCGAGMLDASAAVTAATSAPLARISVSPAALMAQQPVTVSAAGSLLPAGRSATAYAWQLLDGGGIATGFIGATDGSTATFTPSGAGVATVKLSLTDDLGEVASTTLAITVTAAAAGSATTAAPVVAATANTSSTGSGGGGGGAVGGGWLLGLLLAIAVLRSSRVRGGRR